MPDGLPPTLTIDQAAELLQCDRDTAAERLNSGELPGLKLGRSWVIPADAFMRRVNELAIELAEQRRQALKDGRGKRQNSAPEPLPSLTVVAATSGKRGRARRVPPSLESLAGLMRGVA